MKVWTILTVLISLFVIYSVIQNHAMEKVGITEREPVYYTPVQPETESLPPPMAGEEPRSELEETIMGDENLTEEEKVRFILELERMKERIKTLEDEVLYLDDQLYTLQIQFKQKSRLFEDLLSLAQTFMPLLVPIVAWKYRKRLDKPFNRRNKGNQNVS